MKEEIKISGNKRRKKD